MWLNYLFGCNARCLKDELIDLQHDTELQSMFQEKVQARVYAEFWNLIVEEFCLFGSTYICETTFSRLKLIKI